MSLEKPALREKYPNTVFFLFHIFLYSVRIQENMDQKKLRIRTLFTEWVHFDCLNNARFFSNDFGCRSNHIYCNLVRPFLQSVFQKCYLGCGSNRCKGCGLVSHHLHRIIVGVLSHVLIFYFIFWLRFTKVQPVITDHIFHHLMSHSRVAHVFFFPLLCWYWYEGMVCGE